MFFWGILSLICRRLVVGPLATVHDEEGRLAICREKTEFMDPEWIGLPVGGVVHCLSAPGLDGSSEGWAVDSTASGAAQRTGLWNAHYVTDSQSRRDREGEVGVSRVTQG